MHTYCRHTDDRSGAPGLAASMNFLMSRRNAALSAVIACARSIPLKGPLDTLPSGSFTDAGAGTVAVAPDGLAAVTTQPQHTRSQTERGAQRHTQRETHKYTQTEKHGQARTHGRTDGRTDGRSSTPIPKIRFKIAVRSHMTQPMWLSPHRSLPFPFKKKPRCHTTEPRRCRTRESGWL